MELRNKGSQQQYDYAKLEQGKTTRAENPDNQVLTPVTICILAAETGERFAYFGFRAVLVLYFVHSLELEETEAIACYAYTTSLAYLSPLLGAILADGHFGRYKTILYCGVIYIVGLAVLSSAAWFEWPSLFIQRMLTALGLILVCTGTGGIKPCVSAFGADQVAFKSSENELKTSYHDNPSSLTNEQESSLDQEQGADGWIIHNSPVVGENDTTSSQEMTTQRVRTFFAYFYFCINVGAVTSIAMVPIVKQYFGFGPAFSLSLWFMIVAILLFASKRRDYYHIVPGQDGSSLSMTLRLCCWLLLQNIWQHSAWIRNNLSCLEPSRIPVQSFSNEKSNFPANGETDNINPSIKSRQAQKRLQDEQLSDAAQVLHVIPIFGALPIFWSLYDQQSSVWTLQATKMSLHGLQPEQLNVVNPVEIMIFIPLFERIIYPLLEKARVDISHLRRMQWGMFFSAISFFASGIVESWVQYNDKSGLSPPSVLWQLIQITLLAIGEIFVSVTGLEFAYSCAPDRVKAIIMSLFLLTTAVGNVFSGCLYATVFADMNRATVMHVCAVLMLLNMFMFFFLSKWWMRRSPADLLQVATNNQEVEMGRIH